MSWIRRYMGRGLTPVILNAAKIFIVTLVAMILSTVIAELVYSHGGLVRLIADWMAATCAEAGVCNVNSLELALAVILIVIAQVCLMIARISSTSDDIGVRVEEHLEDAELLAAVIGQKGKTHDTSDQR